MSVFLYSTKCYASVLRFLSSQEESDRLYFDTMIAGMQEGLCTDGSFGDSTYDAVAAGIPLYRVQNDAVGLGKVMLANVRAYNHDAANARTPREGVPEATAEHYARQILAAALRQGVKADTRDAIDTVNLMQYNTVDTDGKEHAPTVDGAVEYLADMTIRAFGLLADMWRRGER